MTFFEVLAKNVLIIDNDTEPYYGSDQAYNSYPARFPTVTFKLKETPMLEQIANSLELQTGESYIGINGYTESRVDSFIDIEGNILDITPEEQRIIYSCLDEQCRILLGKSCAELLEEAEERIV